MMHFGLVGYCSFCGMLVELSHIDNCPMIDSINIIDYLIDSQERVNGLLMASGSAERVDFTEAIEREQREQAARQHARDLAGF